MLVIVVSGIPTVASSFPDLASHKRTADNRQSAGQQATPRANWLALLAV